MNYFIKFKGEERLNTKRVLSKERETKITSSIINLLTNEKCTLANYEKIHELVIKHYKENAVLPTVVSKNVHHQTIKTEITLNSDKATQSFRKLSEYLKNKQ